MLFNYIRQPILYQGRKKQNNYFEGWYFKQVSADLKTTICVIPGITKNKRDAHAFIQTITNTRNTNQAKPILQTHYYRFPIQAFRYRDEPFLVRIGKNIFTKNGFILNLLDDTLFLKGKINFSPFTKIKSNLLYPNIMGCFAYLPFMECYHGVVSMNHQLNGALIQNNQKFDFRDGKGYIEKDWGTSFPKEYCWLQSNHFRDADASLMCSVAKIPFLGLKFEGFICNLTIGNKEYRFASYNRSKLCKIQITEHRIALIVCKDDLKLVLVARIQDRAGLKAPKNGIMQNEVKEGLNGVIAIRLQKRTGEVLFQSVGNPCAMEIVKEDKSSQNTL